MTQLYEDTAQSVVLGKIWKGKIANTISGATQKLFVTIPDLDPTGDDLRVGPCEWDSNDSVTFPQRGQDCLVIFDNDLLPWVISWSPVPTTQRVPAPTNGKWLKGSGGAMVWTDIAAADVKGGSSGQFLKSDGTGGTWAGITTTDVSGYPRVTKGSFTTGPPTSPTPVSGDVWVGQLAAGGEWEFVYDAAESTVYKWKFRGGPRIAVMDTAGTVRSATVINTWQAVPNCQIGGMRNGHYNISYGGVIADDTATTVYLGVGQSVGGVFLPYQYRSASPGSSGVAGEIDTATPAQGAITSGNIYLQVDLSVLNSGLGVVFGWISCAPIKVI